MRNLDLVKKNSRTEAPPAPKAFPLEKEASLFEPYAQPAREKKRRSFGFFKILLWIFIFVLCGSLAYGSFFFYRFHLMEQKINPEQENRNSLLGTIKSLTIERSSELKGAESGRINILLLGIAGTEKAGKYLTDTIMVASINTKTDQVALLSLPRDLYVKIPGTKVRTKINSVYQYGINNPEDGRDGIDYILDTVKDITSLDINYYVVLNFQGFEEIIDTVGGINIINERDILDPRYPGPGYSYETFELKKGFHHLDGATALKYARERHADPEGDFGRAKRQQQVLQATKNVVFSTGTFLNVFRLNDLLDALGENIRTNVRTSEIESFISLIKKLDTNNINNKVVDAWNKDSLLKVSHVSLGNSRAFILIPRIGNYKEIRDLAQNIFDLNKLNREKEEVAKEDATVAIINKSGDSRLAGKINNLLKGRLDYANVLILGSSDQDLQDQTTVYDPTNGIKPFTLNDLVTKIPAAAVYGTTGEISKGIEKISPDLVLVLGKDLIDTYNMEEDSVEDFQKASDEENLLDITTEK